MILVTVGTHCQGFDRLVGSMDKLAAELDERVIIQLGSSLYQPQQAEHFRFTTYQEMIRLTREARVVVTHAAAGSIILCLNEGKPLVLVPRLKQLGEALDDHQLQLAKALHDAKIAVSVVDTSEASLRGAIVKAPQLKSDHSGPGQLVEALRRRIQQWERLTADGTEAIKGGW